MKIKMKTLDASPDGVRLPGKIYDVSDKEAKDLIAIGAAEVAPSTASSRRQAPERSTARRGKVADEVPPADDEEYEA